jgi:FimV-like protein
MIRLIKLFLFASAITFIFSAQALQLGKISINSKQEQPLNADIEVILTKADDVTELVPSIASKEDFESQGIERLPVHANINANFVKNSEGKIYLKLKSDKPVKDPFLDLLIQIDSPKGRNYREYTVLLDPPDPMDKMINETLEKDSAKKDNNKLPAKDLAEGKKREIDSEKKSKENQDLIETQQEEVVVEEKKTAKKEQPKEEVKNTKEEAIDDRDTDEQKTVKSVPGKTLYQIARENSLSGVTLEQMVVGIYQNNKKAFAEGNINGLNKNQILTVPSKSYFSDLSHLEARKILKSQNDDWKKLTQPKASENKSTKKPENNKEKEKIEKLELKLAEAEQKLKELAEGKKNNLTPDAENKNKPSEVSSVQKEVIDIKGDDFEIEEIVLDEDAKEASDDVFTSSISADSEINQVVLKDDVKNEKNNLMIVLVLLFLITVVAGIIFFISKKKKNEKPIFSSEINANQQTEPDVIDNLSREDKNSF